MGRQHTIYMSDVTWEQLQSLKKGDESMSQVIRNALEICAANKDTFDLVSHQQIIIEAHRRKGIYFQENMCKKCAQELID